MTFQISHSEHDLVGNRGHRGPAIVKYNVNQLPQGGQSPIPCEDLLNLNDTMLKGLRYPSEVLAQLSIVGIAGLQKPPQWSDVEFLEDAGHHVWGALTSSIQVPLHFEL